jgi:hypothetical protein
LKKGWCGRAFWLAVMAVSPLQLPPASLAQQDGTKLEKITVTARKRVENLQEVALSVSAMGVQEIEANLARLSSSNGVFSLPTHNCVLAVFTVLCWRQRCQSVAAANLLS